MEFEDKIVLEGCKKVYCEYGQWQVVEVVVNGMEQSLV